MELNFIEIKGLLILVSIVLITKFLIFDCLDLNFTLACCIHFIICFSTVVTCNLLLVPIIKGITGYIMTFLLLLLLYFSIWITYISLQKKDVSKLNAVLKKRIH